MDFFKKCDYSQVNVKVQNMQVFDNTNYPKTLSPRVAYTAQDELIENEILGLNRELGSENMLELTFLMFDFPAETRCEK